MAIAVPSHRPVKPTAEPAVVTGKPRVFKAPFEPPQHPARRLRIAQKGWENFNGDFGQVIFKDGVSLEEVGQVQYDRIATQIHVVCADSGAQLGPGQRHLDAKPISAPMIDHSKSAGSQKNVPVAGEEEKSTKLYSREELYRVIDESGIQGLREIGAPLGVKARSIPELVSVILQAQKVLAAKQAGEEPPAEDVEGNDVIDTGEEKPVEEEVPATDGEAPANE